MTPPARRTPASKGKASLTDDLLADLNAPGALPTAPPAAAFVPHRTGGTPALSMTLTPLRWRLPALDAAERGVGVAVRLGPLRVEVAF
jgi:hypothetical protein